MGLIFVLAGIAVIGYADPVIAAGLTAILVGLGLVVRDMVKKLLGAFGFGGGF